MIGGLWGLVSTIGFGIQLTKPITQISGIYDILFFPASISARTLLGPAVGLIIVWPIISILIGVLIGYITGSFLESWEGND